MKAPWSPPLLLLLCAGCAAPSTQAPTHAPAPPATSRAKGPDWAAIDQTVQRVREREANRPRLVETSHITHETGFFAMTEDEYQSALDSARTAVRKEQPKWSEADIETEATKRADDAKRRAELSLTTRTTATTTYELRR